MSAIRSSRESDTACRCASANFTRTSATQSPYTARLGDHIEDGIPTAEVDEAGLLDRTQYLYWVGPEIVYGDLNLRVTQELAAELCGQCLVQRVRGLTRYAETAQQRVVDAAILPDRERSTQFVLIENLNRDAVPGPEHVRIVLRHSYTGRNKEQ